MNNDCFSTNYIVYSDYIILKKNMHKILIIILSIILIPISIPATAKEEKNLYISVSKETHFIVTDPLGRKTGFDPIKNIKYQEAHNQYYLNNNFSGEEGDTSYQYINYESINGSYIITVIGGENYSYTISIGYPHPSNSNQIEQSVQIETWTYTNKIDYYELNYNYELGLKGIQPTLIRIITPSTLIDDITLLKRNKFITDESFITEITNDTKTIEQNKNLNTQEIKENYTKLAEKIKTYKTSNKDKYISDIAKNILLKDIKYIIGHIQ